MPQLLCHLFGDYVFQNQWMADNKTKAHIPCFVHATVYASMFVWLQPHLLAWFVIWATHFVIDRWRLASYWVRWFRVGVRHPPAEAVPPFLAVWLLIIVDNAFHLTINYLSLKYL